MLFSLIFNKLLMKNKNVPFKKKLLQNNILFKKKLYFCFTKIKTINQTNN